MGAYLVEEMPVVGYNDNGVFKIQQEILQPADSRQVQVVGRLVQLQDVRIAEKRLGKQYLDFKVGGKLRHFHIMILVGNAQLVKHESGV